MMPIGTAIAIAISDVMSGAVDRRDRAELVGDRVPVRFDQEAEAEGPQRHHRAVDQGDDDAAEQERDGNRRKLVSASGRRCRQRAVSAALSTVTGRVADQGPACSATSTTVVSPKAPVTRSRADATLGSRLKRPFGRNARSSAGRFTEGEKAPIDTLPAHRSSVRDDKDRLSIPSSMSVAHMVWMSLITFAGIGT